MKFFRWNFLLPKKCRFRKIETFCKFVSNSLNCLGAINHPSPNKLAKKSKPFYFSIQNDILFLIVLHFYLKMVKNPLKNSMPSHLPLVSLDLKQSIWLSFLNTFSVGTPTWKTSYSHSSRSLKYLQKRATNVSQRWLKWMCLNMWIFTKKIAFIVLPAKSSLVRHRAVNGIS